MRLGTYSTFDTPTEKIDDAQAFLTKAFEEIGGEIRKQSNPHDFGEYPSFEIDYPYDLEGITDYGDCTCGECEECLEIMKKDDWNDKAGKIETAYYEKFKKFL